MSAAKVLGVGGRSVGLLAALLALLVTSGCSHKTAEEREREAAAKISGSIPDVDAVALAQKVSPEVVKEVQENLTVVHEYQGDINGKLDSVTVNALQAFQRTAGLDDNGIIDQKTREKLAAAAKSAASN
jgi:peptidoglycan hydrolase-like protein with peptidoglycan-binding domain